MHSGTIPTYLGLFLVLLGVVFTIIWSLHHDDPKIHDVDTVSRSSSYWIFLGLGLSNLIFGTGFMIYGMYLSHSSTYSHNYANPEFSKTSPSSIPHSLE